MCFEKILTALVSSLDDRSNSADAMASISPRWALNSACPTISQVAKRGSANLALHNLLSIPHRKLERHQVGIIPNGLSCPQRHEPGPLFPTTREADRAVGCQVSLYRARQQTFLKQRSKACPQRFASSRPVGIAGDVTEIDPVLYCSAVRLLIRLLRWRQSQHHEIGSMGRGRLCPAQAGQRDAGGAA